MNGLSIPDVGQCGARVFPEHRARVTPVVPETPRAKKNEKMGFESAHV
jgi:hypothetical protein